jgi:hypothetical protein
MWKLSQKDFKRIFQLGMVTHTIIPATWEAEIGGSLFKSSSGTKVNESYLKEQAR